MPETGSLHRYNPDDGAGGLASLLLAPFDVPLPRLLEDIVLTDFGEPDPAELAEDWFCVGLGVEPAGYNHEREGGANEYQQATLFPRITSVQRRFTYSIGEFSTRNLKLVEAASYTRSVVGAAGKSGFDEVGLDVYTRVPTFRAAILTYSPNDEMIVTASDGKTRPRMQLFVGWKVSLAAEGTEISWEADSASGAQVALEFSVDSSAPAGMAHGTIMTEKAQTLIAA